MGFNLVTQGQEQFATDDFVNTSVEVGLYNDSTDSVPVNGTLSDITTEPTNTYGRQTASLSKSIVSNFLVLEAGQVIYDTSGSTQTVDAYFFVRPTGTGGELVLTGQLEDTRNLSEIDELQVSNTGFELTN